MSISRALFSGVSGLRNHGLMMDVISNNIANVNTAGYKASRITFEETFALVVQGASRPPGISGGVNPMQVGLGASVGSIDVLHNQGTLESTGVTTDLAIEGDGFFIVSDSVNQFYTRSGAFQFDSQGNLVNPNNGLAVQGLVANTNGEIPIGTPIGDINLPFGQKSPASATENVSFTGNLNAGDKAIGTKFETKAIYAKELAGSTLPGSDSSIQNMLGLNTVSGQTTVLEGVTPNTTTVTIIDGEDRTSNGVVDADDGFVFTFVENDTNSNFDFNSLQDLVDGVNAVFGTTGFGTLTAAFNSDGSVQFNRGTPLTANIGRISILSTNSNLQRALQTANMEINETTGATNQFSHVATGADDLVNLRDSSGNDLGLVDSDILNFAGRVGGNPIINNTTYALQTGDTVETFTEKIRTAFDITVGSVTTTAEGILQILGDGGTPNELDSINITATDSGGTTSRTFFDNIYDSTPNNYIETQAATDVQASASSTVFDSLGQRHVVTLSFTKDAKIENKWTWESSVKEPATTSGGSTGVITFKTDGSLASFITNGAATAYQFEPQTGALNPVTIDINVGTLGTFDGITQLGTDTSLVANNQDGFGLGELSQISFDNNGRIEGQFTNGRNLLLAQLSIAAFNNESGLLRVGDNMFQQSANSGVPIVGAAGTAIKVKIVPGALEQSNVDLAQEFTNMIVAQRGFQASARVITVSDQILTEVVNLKT